MSSAVRAAAPRRLPRARARDGTPERSRSDGGRTQCGGGGGGGSPRLVSPRAGAAPAPTAREIVPLLRRG